MEGARVGSWRLGELLAEGALARTWRASKSAGQEAVLKIARPDALRSRPQLRDRIVAEMGAARVRHPALARLVDQGMLRLDGVDVPWLAYRFVKGSTLRTLLSERGRLDERDVRRIGARLAEALHALHAAGFVHGDVSPGNVMIAPSGSAVLLDLGLAERMGDASWLGAGEFAGTLSHAAPERVEAAAATPAADIHSLGVVLHEAATGIRREAGDASPLVAARVLRGDVSPGLSDLLADMTAEDPAQRPRTAKQAAAALRGRPAAWRTPRWRARRDAAHAWSRLTAHDGPPLSGRDAEMALLSQAIAQARAGRTRVVTLSGPAGSGKSRLALEAACLARADGAVLLAGEIGQARSPLRDALLGGGSPEELARRLRRRAGVAAGRRAALERADASSSAARDAALLLADEVRARSRRKLVVLVLDGVSASDRATWDALAALAASPRGTKLLAIATCRSPASSTALLARAAHVPIALSPRADATAAADALRASLAALDADDRELLVLLALSAGEVTPSVLAEATGRGIPEVARRLASLAWEHRLLRIGSTGHRVDAAVREALAEMHEAERAVRHRRLAEAHARCGSTPLVQARHVVEGGADAARLVALVPDAVEQARAAREWGLAAEIARLALDRVEPEARAKLLLLEGLSLRDAARPDEARRAFEAARDEARARDDEPIALRAEIALAASEPMPRASEALEALAGRMVALPARASALTARVPALTARDSALPARVPALTAPDDARIELAWCTEIARVRFAMRRHADSAEAARRGLVLAERLADDDARIALLGSLGIAVHHLGRSAEARRLFEKQLAEIERTGCRGSEPRAWNSLAMLSHALGRLGDALRFARRSVRAARETGDVQVEMVALSNIAFFAHDRGALATAAQALQELEPLPWRADPAMEAVTLIRKAEVTRARLDDRHARELFARAIDAARRAGDDGNLSQARLHLAVMDAEAGDWEAAAEGCRAVMGSRDAGMRLIGGALLAALGGEALDRVDPSAPANLRARAHWICFAGTGAVEHLERATAVLEEIAASLPADEREDFWQRSIGRNVRAAWDERRRRGLAGGRLSPAPARGLRKRRGQRQASRSIDA